MNIKKLFSEIAKRGASSSVDMDMAAETQADYANANNSFILEDLSSILNHIEQSTMGSESEEDFGNLFSDLDLTSHKLGKSEADKNELIVKVLVHLEEIDFDLENTDSDVLGDAYEYLMRHFATESGKSKGQFYTPAEVSRIMAKIIGINNDIKEEIKGSVILRPIKLSQTAKKIITAIENINTILFVLFFTNSTITFGG